MMHASVARWGNSLAVRVPKEAVRSAGLREGATLDLTVENGAIVLRPRRFDIKDLVAAMAEVAQLPLIFDVAPRGGEVW